MNPPSHSIELLEFTTGGDAGAQPAASIIVLHGLGADGSDFVPVAEAMDLSAVGPVRFVFPSAPVRPVTINNGMPMRAWYDIVSLDFRSRADASGVAESVAQAEALIAREQARGTPRERILLAGFSQGGAITLSTGLRQ